MLLPRQNWEAERSTCQAGFKGAQPGRTTGQMTADGDNSRPSLRSPAARLTARPYKRTVESKPLVSYYHGLCPHITPCGAAVCADHKHQSCNVQCSTSNSSVPLSSRTAGSKIARPSENIINSSTHVKAFLLERPPLVIKRARAKKKVAVQEVALFTVAPKKPLLDFCICTRHSLASVSSADPAQQFLLKAPVCALIPLRSFQLAKVTPPQMLKIGLQTKAKPSVQKGLHS